MIDVKNITKRFGTFTAVDDISFTIHEGDIVGLLGPNGAGKTTTMRMLTGYLVPDKGSIKVNGESIAHSEFAIKSEIGYMPENNPVYTDMLVKEYLELTLELNSIPKQEWDKKIAYVLKAVGIEDKFYRPIEELSKGYKQRVGIASALITDPKVLILDEPTEGLDPSQRKEIRNLIKGIGKERTVIISTHVMQEVEAMCNKILIVRDGEIVVHGTKDEVLAMKSKSGGTVSVALSGTKIKSGLSSMKTVKLLDISKEGKKEIATLSITEKDQDKVFEELTQQIVKNKWTVYGLQTAAQSLEDLFHEITTK
ncbi:ATP-binding cassette domain-containing protein [Candidatus Dojkabacteria bacterium]|uniref:ATP-binding cassette domain-containing protein n=1 Tax=Candidatus Dojkabacteria bacterium TaxID=2099670 RepID=A0A955RKW5_9BACT|nr:ATP-binding cassette domain-containing protein [Candidatus Dojkabacteria bacterium]